MLSDLFLLTQLDINYDLVLEASILCTDTSAEPSQRAAPSIAVQTDQENH